MKNRILGLLATSVLLFSANTLAGPTFSNWHGDLQPVDKGANFRGFMVSNGTVTTGTLDAYPDTCLGGSIVITPLDAHGVKQSDLAERLEMIYQEDGGHCESHYHDLDGSFAGLDDNVMYKLDWFGRRDGVHYGHVSHAVVLIEPELIMGYNRVEGDYIGTAVTNGFLNMAFLTTWAVHTSGQCVAKVEMESTGKYIGEVIGHADKYGSCLFTFEPSDLGTQAGTVKINIQNNPFTDWYGAFYIDLHEQRPTTARTKTGPVTLPHHPA